MNSQTYGNELLSENLRSKFSAVTFGFFALAGIGVNLVSFKVVHFSFYIYLSSISIALTLPLYFCLVESPFYLYKQKKIKQLYSCLLRICQMNHSKDELLSVKAAIQSKLKYGRYFALAQHSGDGGRQAPLDRKSHDHFSLRSAKIRQPCLTPAFEPENGWASQLSANLLRQDLWLFVKVFFLYLQSESIAVMSLIVNKQLGISVIQFSGVFVAVFQIIGSMAGFCVVPRLGRRSINLMTAVLICVYSAALLVTNAISNYFVAYFERSQTVRLIETGKRK